MKTTLPLCALLLSACLAAPDDPAEGVGEDTEAIGTSLIITGPPNPTNQSTATFELSQVIGSTYQCSLDAGAYLSCGTHVTYTGLHAGAHTFNVRTSGLLRLSASYTWTIDLTPPEVTIVMVAPPVTAGGTAPFTFTASEPVLKFQCELDGGAPVTCGSPTPVGPLWPGTHLFSVSATDRAGNIGWSFLQFTVHFGPPAVTITSPYEGEVVFSSMLEVDFEANQAATFTCTLDGSATFSCTSPLELYDLADGPHALVVSATAFGQVGTATRKWITDSVAPSLSVLFTGYAGGTATYWLSTNKPLTLACTFDDGPTQPCGPTWYAVVAGPGQHSLYVTGTDALGVTVTREVVATF